MVIGQPAGQDHALVADEAAHEAAVEPQRQHVDHGVGRTARADIAKARQQGRADDVVVAEHRGADRQMALDAPELAPVQHLPVREVDVGDAEFAPVEHLADPVDQHARGQGDDLRRLGPGNRAPHRQSVDAPRQLRPGIDAADPVLQGGDLLRCLLHQQQVGTLLLDQRDEAIHRRAGAAQQIPAHDLLRVRARLGGDRRGASEEHASPFARGA
ncbi:hypothetical protein AX289_15875 [Methylorubrum populi]|nr:hypothetical protein AX289_15875 [Methylorubrum populi]